MLLNNRYEYNPTTDLIGKGGLAEVFKAYDKEFDRYVAIKKFNTADSPMKYSLKNEFQKSLHFAHDNLVRAYDFFTVVRKYEDGETHETQYGVMELVEGGDLSVYLKKKPPLSELLEVVKGILRGLDYLHTPNPNTDKKTIIHRDIKPGNILIYYNRQGKPIPKIADFNVAKEASTTAESSHSQVGTYEYMAPEQLNSGKYGVGGQVHANTDLWALGVILCDYLMVKSLFGKRSEGCTQGQIIGRILDESIPFEDIKKLPVPFNGIIARCLVRKAKDRVQSASELLTWLNSIEETTIITESTTSQSTGNATLNTKIWLIGLYLVLLIVLGLYFLLKPERDIEQNITEMSITPPVTIIDDPFANQMVYIEGGTFMMGCTSDQGRDCFDNEYPAHDNTINSFSIGKYEVTQSQWLEVMGNNPSDNKICDQCPVENVSYDDIQNFLSQLNRQTGKNYRLPTEKEWEFAARSGNQKSNYKYSGSNSIDTVAWYYNTYNISEYGSKGTTHPVGTKKANELGLYDMSGNVWEWCSEWYIGYPGSSGIDDYSGLSRVLRGGGWRNDARRCRVAFRYHYAPDRRSNSIGFRVVLDK